MRRNEMVLRALMEMAEADASECSMLEEAWGDRTKHFDEERAERLRMILDQIGYGNVICSNIQDRGHMNGPELFALTDTGIILVFNARTKRHITDLIARPQQIYDRLGDAFARLPEATRMSVIALAQEHQDLGYNNW